LEKKIRDLMEENSSLLNECQFHKNEVNKSKNDVENLTLKLDAFYNERKITKTDDKKELSYLKSKLESNDNLSKQMTKEYENVKLEYEHQIENWKEQFELMQMKT